MVMRFGAVGTATVVGLGGVLGLELCAAGAAPSLVGTVGKIGHRYTVRPTCTDLRKVRAGNTKERRPNSASIPQIYP